MKTHTCQAAIRSFAAIAVLCMHSPSWGVETYFVSPLQDLVKTSAASEQRAKLPASTQTWSYGVLEGSGEIYVVDVRTDQGPEVQGVVAIRIDDGRNPVRGAIYVPGQGMERRSFEVTASSTSLEDRRKFLEAKRSHLWRLLNDDLPGAAWFRHQYREASEALGQSGSQAATNRRFFGNRTNDLLNTYALFSGGRAVAENLQLDRTLPDPPANTPLVAIDSLEGITVREFDWKPLVQGLRPELDPSARLVPHDQHAVFFPSFDAFLRTLDHLREVVGPLTTSFDPDTVYEFLQTRYEQQLALPLDATVRAFGKEAISSVTLTGGDPYLRTGSDVAFIFEAPNPDALVTLIATRASMAAIGRKADAETGDIEGVRYTGYRTPDRRVSSYWARVNNFVVLSNSTRQLQRIIEAEQKQTNCLADLDEYRFFRDRYPRGASNETGLLLVPDAAIRRWCGPAWRIATSRRSRAAAVMAEMQAMHLADLADRTRTGSAMVIHPPFPLPHPEPLTLDQFDLRSATFGSLAFQTPISEMDLANVTASEADLYRQWREGYQQAWRNFFDPIALRFEVSEQQLEFDLTVMPLIEGSDYQRLISVVRGAKIGADQGDRHRGALLHFAMSLNHDSDIVRSGTNLLENLAPQIRIDPLSWLGDSVAVYLDHGPLWDELAKAKISERDDALWETAKGIPVALIADVRSGLKLTAFLAGVRAYIEQTAPGMTVWTSEEHEGEPYVKIAPSERARSSQNEIENVALYYLAAGDMLLVTLDESILHAVISRRKARKGPEGTAAGDPAGPAQAPPWLGQSLCLQVDQNMVSLADTLLSSSANPPLRRRSFNNLPILNEWKRLYPDRDPVQFHEEVWHQRLVCPGGGTYRWNDEWKTMESTVYGHPGAPKEGPRLPAEVRGFAFGNLGVTFDEHGLRSLSRLTRGQP